MKESHMDFEYFLEKNGIWHRFAESHSTKSAREAADNAGVPFEKIIKTLAFETQDEVYLVIAKAVDRVSTKKLKKLLNISDTRLASAAKVKEATGYEVGAVPPIGLSDLRIFMDEKVLDMQTAWAGGGKTNRIVELRIEDVIKFSQPTIADVSE